MPKLEEVVSSAMSLVLRKLRVVDRIEALEKRAPERGEKGERGDPGIAGKDGAPGERGQDGAPGPKGERGEVGAPGAAGKDGAPGAPGAAGKPGERGEQGEPGLEGKAGEPGRDAAQIDVLPYIEDDRSYARGTFASYRGGLVRAARTTDYLDTLKEGETIETKGWQIVVNGLGDREIKQVDDRTFAVRLVDTAGKVTEAKIEMPVMIYRGVWRDGPYARGDTATWGGSLWHCEEPTQDKPGTSKAWKLCVKKGADGKDARA